MTNRTYRCHHCLDTGTIRITGPDETINGRIVRGQVSAHNCNYCTGKKPAPAPCEVVAHDADSTEAGWVAFKRDNPDVWAWMCIRLVRDTETGRASMARTIEDARARFRLTINNDWSSYAARHANVALAEFGVCLETRAARADRVEA